MLEMARVRKRLVAATESRRQRYIIPSHRNRIYAPVGLLSVNLFSRTFQTTSGEKPSCMDERGKERRPDSRTHASPYRALYKLTKGRKKINIIVLPNINLEPDFTDYSDYLVACISIGGPRYSRCLSPSLKQGFGDFVPPLRSTK
jgi:hypothetical protein